MGGLLIPPDAAVLRLPPFRPSVSHAALRRKVCECAVLVADDMCLRGFESGGLATAGTQVAATGPARVHGRRERATSMSNQVPL